MALLSKLIGVSALVGAALFVPKLQTFIAEQNKFFDEVSVYTPDVSDLQMIHLSDLEKQDGSVNIVDDKSGTLKHSGYLLRDHGLNFNREAVKDEPSNNWLKENTKRRHQTLIITFGKKKISL